MLKRFRNRRLLPAGSTPCNGGPEISAEIQMAIDKLCPPSCPPPSPEIAQHYSGGLAWLDVAFSLEELRVALRSVKSSSSPGLDRIDYRLIKTLPSDLLICLLSFKQPLPLFYFPYIMVALPHPLITQT